MNIVKTTIDRIKSYRTEYFRLLPEFQELFLELMMDSSDCYLFQIEDNEIGYAIKNTDGVLIEFYVINKYIPECNLFFNQVQNDLSVTEIYCKSFDALLLKYCLLNSFSYSVIGVLYRDYDEAIIKKDLNIEMVKADLSSISVLLEQDDSIKVLFDTEQQLSDFIQKEHVFTFLQK